MSTRYSLRQTPRKKELFDGMVETPSTRSRSRKSLFPIENSDAENDSSSAAESTAKSSRSRTPARRRLPKFVEHIDETDDTDSQANDSFPTSVTDEDVKPSMASSVASSSRGNGIPKPIPGKGTESEPLIKTEHAVDGWKPGADYRVDYSGHKEFGGSFGVSAMMIGFPLLMWYMWIGSTFYGGGLPLPTEGQTLGEFFQHLFDLVHLLGFPHS